jgi:glycosidase
VQPDILHSVTNYILFKALFSSHNDNNMFELAHTLKNSVPQNGLPLYNFLDNHDQPRIASNVTHPGFLNTLYALLFTLPGIPSIYYGSEWGIKGVKGNGTDAPMRPYIDINDPPQNTELVALIRKLAKIRQSMPALRYGDYREVHLEYHKPFVFERSYNGQNVTVAINTNGNPETIHGSGIDLLTGETFFGEAPIAPYSSRVLAPEGTNLIQDAPVINEPAREEATQEEVVNNESVQEEAVNESSNMKCINVKECVCPKKDCENYGKCCECVKAHRGTGSLPFCLP